MSCFDKDNQTAAAPPNWQDFYGNATPGFSSLTAGGIGLQSQPFVGGLRPREGYFGGQGITLQATPILTSIVTQKQGEAMNEKTTHIVVSGGTTALGGYTFHESYEDALAEAERRAHANQSDCYIFAVDAKVSPKRDVVVTKMGGKK